MKKPKQSYDKEFKRMAVELCLSGKPAQETADDLGITASMLNRWRREYEAAQQGDGPSSEQAQVDKKDQEILRLRKELREARLEAEILKSRVNPGNFPPSCSQNRT